MTSTPPPQLPFQNQGIEAKTTILSTSGEIKQQQQQKKGYLVTEFADCMWKYGCWWGLNCQIEELRFPCTGLKLEGEEGNGITCEELEWCCCPLSLFFPITMVMKDPSSSSGPVGCEAATPGGWEETWLSCLAVLLTSPPFLWTLPASSISFFLCNFSSASFRNLNFGGGEDHTLMKSSSFVDSKRGLNPLCL